MSILWTTLRFPNLAWACCGFLACFLGVQTTGQQDQPARRAPAGKPAAQPAGKQGGKAAVGQAPRRHFLGFELPEGKSVESSDERQRFEVVPALSRVGVDLNTPLGSVTAKSSAMRGGLVCVLNRPEAGATAWLVLETAKLSTGHARHDAMIHDALRAGTHPEIRFTLASFTVTRVDRAAGTLAGTATCTMRICGHAHRLQVPVEVHQEQAPDGQLVAVKGEVKVKLSEMGVAVPRTFGIPLIHDEITLWLGLRGRPLGPQRHHTELARAR